MLYCVITLTTGDSCLSEAVRVYFRQGGVNGTYEKSLGGNMKACVAEYEEDLSTEGSHTCRYAD